MNIVKHNEEKNEYENACEAKEENDEYESEGQVYVARKLLLMPKLAKKPNAISYSKLGVPFLVNFLI